MADETFAPNFCRQWVECVLENFGPLTEVLGELDRRAGDGDFGQNISTALRLAGANTHELGESDPDSAWLTALYRGFLGVGGTSGPLFAMWFREFARHMDSPKGATVRDFLDALSDGLAVVQHYGNAETGQKTMVDAMAPAAQTDASWCVPQEALHRIVDAAVDGARSTAGIVAKRGRASYVGETARDVIDPGAVTTAVILQCALEASGGPSVDTEWIQGD